MPGTMTLTMRPGQLQYILTTVFSNYLFIIIITTNVYKCLEILEQK